MVEMSCKRQNGGANSGAGLENAMEARVGENGGTGGWATVRRVLGAVVRHALGRRRGVDGEEGKDGSVCTALDRHRTMAITDNICGLLSQNCKSVIAGANPKRILLRWSRHLGKREKKKWIYLASWPTARICTEVE